MGLREDILKDPVSELEIRELLPVKPKDKIRAAVKLMRAKRLGCVVVVDDNGRPLGKFTEKELLALLLKSPAAMDEAVGDHMTSAWAFVEMTDPIAKVLDAMQSKGLRFVIVLDENGKAVGLTGQKGLMEYLAEHFPRQVKVQMMESKLYMDHREGA